jgi:hypothetical protein
MGGIYSGDGKCHWLHVSTNQLQDMHVDVKLHGDVAMSADLN